MVVTGLRGRWAVQHHSARKTKRTRAAPRQVQLGGQRQGREEKPRCAIYRKGVDSQSIAAEIQRRAIDTVQQHEDFLVLPCILGHQNITKNLYSRVYTVSVGLNHHAHSIACVCIMTYPRHEAGFALHWEAPCRRPNPRHNNGNHTQINVSILPSKNTFMVPVIFYSTVMLQSKKMCEGALILQNHTLKKRAEDLQLSIGSMRHMESAPYSRTVMVI